MEQLSVTTKRDDERMYKILSDLMNTDKEFQIMITVPGNSTLTQRIMPAEEKDKRIMLSSDDWNADRKTDTVSREVSHDLEKDVTEMIHEIGVPAHIKGYHYLREAIMMCVEDVDMLNAITKALYPEIAKKFHATDQKVERGIRNAIEVSWMRGNQDTFTTIFGYSSEDGHNRPTNSEYIARLADKVRLDFRE